MVGHRENSAAPNRGRAGGRVSLHGLLVARFPPRRGRAGGERRARARPRARSVPAFFLAVHLICAAAILLGLADRGAPPPLSRAARRLIVALDLGLWVWFRRRPISSLAPHVAIRGAALYAIVAGALWCAAGYAAGAGRRRECAPARHRLRRRHARNPGRLPLLPGADRCSAASPASAELFFLSDDPGGGVAAALLVAAAWSGSASGARRRCRPAPPPDRDRLVRAARLPLHRGVRAGRPRLVLGDDRARRALLRLGAARRRSARPPAERADRQAVRRPDRARRRRAAESSERTLGFHLSARLPFTDITVRANTAAEIWWSLSGTPSFDEYGRFLGFRGIGTDLTQQRRSEEEINRLAKYDSLTGLPNRMLMRRTLDEALQSKSGAAARLRAVPDRSRPLQERQRHARPPDRRRAAQAGRAAARPR